MRRSNQLIGLAHCRFARRAGVNVISLYADTDLAFSSRLFKDPLESGEIGVDSSLDPTGRERP